MLAWTTPAEVADLAGGRVDGCGDLALEIMAASEQLYLLSGRRYGTFVASERPCDPASRCVPREASWLLQGAWWSWWLPTGGPACDCRALGRVRLRGAPVVSVSSVRVGGVALVEGTHYAVDGRWLVPLGGYAFPACQDQNAAADAAGSFVVDYEYGTVVPTGGRVAAAALAAELARGMSGKDCRVPANATTVSRTGVTITRSLRGGEKVGLPAVDSWLAAVNPMGVRRPARVSSVAMR